MILFLFFVCVKINQHHFQRARHDIKVKRLRLPTNPIMNGIYFHYKRMSLFDKILNTGKCL